jgi:hypothetical protein
VPAALPDPGLPIDDRTGRKADATSMNGAANTRSTEAHTTSNVRFAKRVYGRCQRWKMLMNHVGLRSASGIRPNAWSKKCA